MFTTLLAIYSSVIATILGGIAVYNFIRESRVLRVEKDVSYSGDDVFYRFVLSNISSRRVTLIDCMTLNMARTPDAKLEADWGYMPQRIKNLFGEEPEEKLELPCKIESGEILIIGFSSSHLIEHYKFYASSPINGKEKWEPTNLMLLELKHSLSTNAIEMKFELEGNEIQRLNHKRL